MYKFPAKSLKATPLNPERLINYFPRVMEEPAMVGLYARSGLQAAEAGAGGASCNALWQFDGKLWGSWGGVVRYVSGSSWVTVDRITNDAQMQVAPSIYGCAIVSANTYYLIEKSGTSYTITSYNTGEVATPKGVAYLNGYFVVIGESATRDDVVAWSDAGDGTTFQALNFNAAQVRTDAALQILSHQNALWILGEETTELWYPSDTGDPVQRADGATIARGLLSRGLTAIEDSAVYWIGEDRVVYRSFGGAPEAISTRWVEDILRTITVNAAFTMQDRGHKFYVIRPSGSDERPSLAFDMTTGAWCELSGGDVLSPYPPRASVFFQSVQYLGDTSGRFAFLRNDTSNPTIDYYRDFGVDYPCVVTTGPVNADGQHFALARVELVMETGEYAYMESVPLVEVEVSRNGGPWSLPKTRSMGAVGQQSKRIRWHGLGYTTRDMRFRFTCSSPVPRDIGGVVYG